MYRTHSFLKRLDWTWRGNGELISESYPSKSSGALDLRPEAEGCQSWQASGGSGHLWKNTAKTNARGRCCCAWLDASRRLLAQLSAARFQESGDTAKCLSCLLCEGDYPWDAFMGDRDL